jgi:hypothetical protein
LAVLAGTTLALSAQDKQKFEPKFEAGKSFFQKVSTTVEQTVKVQGGTDMKLKHEQTFYFKWTPEKQDGEKWIVKQVIEGVVLKVDIGGNPVSYDSTSDTPNANNSGLADFFKNLINSEFKITFTKTGAVEKVEGKDDFVRKLGSANPQMEQLLKKILSDEALKEMSDPLGGLTPPAEKAVNETWEKKANLPLGPIGSYDRTLKFTYKGKDATQKELDRVEADVNLVYKAPTMDTDGLLFRIKGGNLGIDDKNKKPAEYLFDAKAGRLVSSKLNVVMTGKLNVSIGTTETEVELYQTQATSIESAEKSLLPAKKQ